MIWAPMKGVLRPRKPREERLIFFDVNRNEARTPGFPPHSLSTQHWCEVTCSRTILRIWCCCPYTLHHNYYYASYYYTGRATSRPIPTRYLDIIARNSSCIGIIARNRGDKEALKPGEQHGSLGLKIGGFFCSMSLGIV
jgi:hypothetical protein